MVTDGAIKVVLESEDPPTSNNVGDERMKNQLLSVTVNEGIELQVYCGLPLRYLQSLSLGLFRDIDSVVSKRANV